MYSPAYIWGKILSNLENRLTPEVASTFFAETDVVTLEDNVLILHAPTSFCKDVIERRCAEYIKDAMLELFDRKISVRVLDNDEYREYLGKPEKTQNGVSIPPQYTFDSFVIGSSNDMAANCAKKVSENPVAVYNPLFIYGDSGLGKTHLLYAIANETRKNFPNFKIVYVHGEQFLNELIEAIRAGKNVEFREKYRNADLFLMDDVQFIAGKDTAQVEFFNTFNSLYEKGRQIVITSDRAPNNMTILEDRLRTRFEWGMITDIKAPTYETRMAIIRNKADTLGIDLDNEICDFIAQNLTNNVRQIEGAVTKIKAYNEIGMTLSVSEVSRIIKDFIRKGTQGTPSVPAVIGEVAKFYSIDETSLRGTKKDKVTTEARHIAMYLLREMMNLSFPEIGREFGKDHTTAIYGYNKVKETLLANPSSGLQENLRDIKSNIYSRLQYQ